MNQPYRFGLLGYRVAYSRSPQVFRAIFDLVGREGSFEIFNVAPRQLRHRFAAIAHDGVTGLSVTIPHKRRVFDLLDEVHPVAEALQAVNSVALERQQSTGFNTDCFGFSLALEPFTGRLKHGRALVLGAGGGAKAAIYALHADHELDHCTVVARSQAKLARLRKLLGRCLPELQVECQTYQEMPEQHHDTFEITVNCTPAGGWNSPDVSPLPGGFGWSDTRIYYDLNYNAGNKIIDAARSAGIVVLDGALMLSAQAARSFEIWTGQTIDALAVHDRVLASDNGNNGSAT